MDTLLCAARLNRKSAWCNKWGVGEDLEDDAMLRTVNKHLEKLVQPMIEDAGDGRTIVYPGGIFGRGVVLTQERDKTRFVRLTITTYLLAPLLGVLVYHLARDDWQYALAASAGGGAVCLVVHALALRFLFHGLDRTPSPISNRSSLRRFSARIGTSKLVFGIVVCAIFLLLAVLIMLSGNIFIGVIVAIIFGMLLAINVILMCY